MAEGLPRHTHPTGGKQMTKPTHQDAMLMLAFAEWANNFVQRRARRFVWGGKFIADHAEFVKKYPPGSRQYDYVTQQLGAMETLGTMYKMGLFNEELLFEWQAIYPLWDRLESHVLGRREEAGDPRILENFDYMAKEARKRKPS
jgi:hypothetical protein